MKRFIVPLIFGLGGAAILVTLSLWQFQRLAWKQALIAEIEARISDAPEALPADPVPARDAYLPVQASGEMRAEALHVLTSLPPEGPGFRVIAPFRTEDGRRILVDRGYVPEAEKSDPLATGPMQVTGHLVWPRETDAFTPDPNRERNIWFARDVGAMAAELDTEPVMIVAARPTGQPSPRPVPVSVDLVNNHLQYALTWALLAVVWLAMTLYLLYRIRRNTA